MSGYQPDGSYVAALSIEFRTPAGEIRRFPAPSPARFAFLPPTF